MLTRYLEANPSLGLLPNQHGADLRRLQELRFRVQDASNRNVHGDVPVEELHEYYNCLLECESKGILGDDTLMSFEWESALTGQPQCQGSLAWERANIVWNLATIEAWHGCQEPCADKASWSQAALHFQNAASWLQHLPQSVADSMMVDFSDTFLEFWQGLLVALSQRCGYESRACAARPRHFLLAKLAAAAVPLYGELEVIIQEDEHAHHLLNQVPALTNTWADYSRAWGMYMSAKAEYHQAMVGREKKEWGQELSRLDLASRFASLCLQYCERAQLTSLQQLHLAVRNDIKLLHERLHQARHDNEMLHQQPVPQPKDLAEIRGEKLVNIDQPLTKLLLPMQGEPLFEGGSDTPDIGAYIEQFRTEMKDLLEDLSMDVEERTQAAQAALANANLPHSVTTYEMEQQGGGIPTPLWTRVEKIQQEGHIAKLKQDLWELRDVSEVAKTTFQKVQSQLDFDLESDKLFRKENPKFEGHDVDDIQRRFRQALANYENLLSVAQEGDTILLRRLEQLDVNPKYKLLQFQKAQLDRLLPGTGGIGPAFDTTQLRRLLVELSKLIEDRENLLRTLEQEIQDYDIQATLEAHIANGQDFGAVFKYAKSAFDGLLFEIRANFDKQSALLRSIMLENDFFLQAQGKGDTSATDSCIAMIEDAIVEIKQLSSHLAEGKAFYDVIIPKLEKLKIQVGDVSARLTIERLEYDDQVHRTRQEAADAEMAKRISSESNATGTARQPPPAIPPTPPRPTPGPTPVDVDDEKVANLVVMGFDPSRVVAALRRHRNDLDQALNELLCG